MARPIQQGSAQPVYLVDPSTGQILEGSALPTVIYDGNGVAINVLASAAGNNQEVQYNNGGALAGAGNMLYDGTNLSMNDANITNVGDIALDTISADGASVTINNLITVTSNVGIGVSDPDTTLEVFNAGTQLKLSYDESEYATFAVTAAGNLTISATGGIVNSYRASGVSELIVQSGNADAEMKIKGVQTGSNGIFGALEFHNDGDDVAAIKALRNANDDAAEMRFYTQATGGAITERMRILSTGYVGIGVSPTAGQLHIDQSDASGAIAVLKLDQGDISEEFIDYIGASAASVANPISTWTTGNSIQGFIRVGINGSFYWMPFYSAPTS